MTPFLTQAAELCRTNRTGAKWVIVPSYALGHTLGERLVLEGTDWANLRFTTPIDLALQMAAPFLVERGVDPSSEGLGPALIMSLLLELPETVFAPVSAFFTHLLGLDGSRASRCARAPASAGSGRSAGDVPKRADRRVDSWPLIGLVCVEAGTWPSMSHMWT